MSTWTNMSFVGDKREMGNVFANDKRERTMTHLMQPRLDQYAKNLLRDALSLASILPETEVEVLVHFRIDLALFAAKDGEPMSAEIRAWYENYENKLRQEGRNEVLMSQRAILLRQLRARFGEVPSSMIARVEAGDAPLLEKWSERVISAPTLADVFDATN